MTTAARAKARAVAAAYAATAPRQPRATASGPLSAATPAPAYSLQTTTATGMARADRSNASPMRMAFMGWFIPTPTLTMMTPAASSQKLPAAKHAARPRSTTAPEDTVSSPFPSGNAAEA